ncbi:ISLre2 family transposase, partial [Limosilactobacillus reuteri]
MDILTEIEQNLVKSGSLFEAEQIILKGVLELGQVIMQNFLESLDRSLKSQAPANYQVINKQPRTLNFIFGPVTFQRLIGSVESSHRAFTYRMKKQGKSWTKQGAKAMIGLIEARMNGELQASLNTILEQLTVLPRVAQTSLLQEMHIRTGEFLRKA